MKVAIDARAVKPQLQGVGRYVLNLLLGLSFSESELEFVVFYRNPLARKLVERSGGPFRGRFQWVKSVSRPGGLREKLELPFLLKMNRIDLFHDTMAVGVRSARADSVVTVHELSSREFGPLERFRRIRHASQHAKRVIAVSESISKEIVEHLGVSRDKITMVYNAIDPWYLQRVTDREIKTMRERFHLESDYFFVPLPDKKQKNIGFVRRYLQSAQRRGGTGTWVFSASIPSAEQTKSIGLVEDVWLRPLYAASRAVVIPSLYEGFSLTPLEALSVGAVPIVSDIPTHREILDAILPNELFFNPKDERSLEYSIEAFRRGGEPLHQTIHARFRSEKGRFSYLENAARVKEVYLSCG